MIDDEEDDHEDGDGWGWWWMGIRMEQEEDDDYYYYLSGHSSHWLLFILHCSRDLRDGQKTRRKEEDRIWQRWRCVKQRRRECSVVEGRCGWPSGEFIATLREILWEICLSALSVVFNLAPTVRHWGRRLPTRDQIEPQWQVISMAAVKWERKRDTETEWEWKRERRDFSPTVSKIS